MPKMSPAQVIAKAQAKAKRNALENAFALQIKQMDLPEPEREVKMVPGRNYKVDFVWKSYSTVVEINGGTWTLGGHSSGKGIQRDYDKSNALNLLGYCVLAFTGDDVKSGRAIETLKKALQINQEYPF